MEIATLVNRFEKYCDFFKVTEEDVVDMNLIRELIDIEIQILRCDNLIARDADFVEMVIAGVSNTGKEYKRPELKQSVQLKEKLRSEKHRIFKLLDSTREDRAKKLKNGIDPGQAAVELIAKMKDLQNAGLLKTVFVTQQDDAIDAEFSEVDYREPDDCSEEVLKEINIIESEYNLTSDDLENSLNDTVYDLDL